MNRPVLTTEVPARSYSAVRAFDDEHPILRIAYELGVSGSTLCSWVNQDEIKGGERETTIYKKATVEGAVVAQVIPFYKIEVISEEII